MSERKTITVEMRDNVDDFFSIVNPGDYVEESIVEDFLGLVPPASNSYGYMQYGEPYSHEWNNEKEAWQPTYITFSHERDKWVYNGHCFLGKKEDITCQATQREQ